EGSRQARVAGEVVVAVGSGRVGGVGEATGAVHIHAPDILIGAGADNRRRIAAQVPILAHRHHIGSGRQRAGRAAPLMLANVPAPAGLLCHWYVRPVVPAAMPVALSVKAILVQAFGTEAVAVVVAGVPVQGVVGSTFTR
nr:hypothetical protein [Tanacetum cinerariifolium]